MAATVEKESVSPTAPVRGAQDQNLLLELRERLDALCRYAERVSAEADPNLRRSWIDLESEEMRRIQELRELIQSRMDYGGYLDDF